MAPAMATYTYSGSPKSSDWAGVTEGARQGGGLVCYRNFRFCERRQEAAGSGPRGSGHHPLCIGSSWTHRYLWEMPEDRPSLHTVWGLGGCHTPVLVSPPTCCPRSHPTCVKLLGQT